MVSTSWQLVHFAAFSFILDVSWFVAAFCNNLTNHVNIVCFGLRGPKRFKKTSIRLREAHAYIIPRILSLLDAGCDKHFSYRQHFRCVP